MGRIAAANGDIAAIGLKSATGDARCAGAKYINLATIVGGKVGAGSNVGGI